MKIYKLKHVPTGLYFQPHKHRGSHLSKNGKIYQTAAHGLSEVFKNGSEFFIVHCKKDSRSHILTKDLLIWGRTKYGCGQLKAITRVKDWKIEYL
jgi:hypothetical protein